MRHTSARAYTPKKAGAIVKRMYKKSVRNIKTHPRSSIGILTLGAGLISGALLLNKFRKH